MANFAGTLVAHDPDPAYSGSPELDLAPTEGSQAALGERHDPRVEPDVPRREP